MGNLNERWTLEMRNGCGDKRQPLVRDFVVLRLEV